MKKRKLTLAKEISTVLVLKCLGLFLLWGLFFSHPVADELSPVDVVKHLVS